MLLLNNSCVNGPDNPQPIPYILADVAGLMAGLNGGASGGASPKMAGPSGGLGAGLRTCHVNGRDRHPSTQLTAYILPHVCSKTRGKVNLNNLSI